MGKYFVVDIESDGPCPTMGNITEIGAVFFHDFSKTFYAALKPIWPDKSIPEYANIAKNNDRMKNAIDPLLAMQRFEAWIKQNAGNERPIFVSDNPGFDFMWTHTYFWMLLGYDPFGHSGRRIGDIWAGYCGDLRRPWKQLRETNHDHNPTNDALGNAEALAKILKMMKERP